jgi:hypothetical protein
MFKAPFMILAAVGLVVSAGPALAKAAKSDEPSVRMTVKQKDGHKLYCVRTQPTTGSIVATDICKSREEWAQAGLDIPTSAGSADGNAAKSAGAARLSD